jgi:hypothetical protein
MKELSSLLNTVKAHTWWLVAPPVIFVLDIAPENQKKTI